MKTPSNQGLRRTYVNLKKANWDRYNRQEVEAALSKRSLPTDCQRDEKIFRTVLLKAASHHIPTGRHLFHEQPVPEEILDMSNELLLCKHKHFKHQNKGEAIMYPSLVEYMYNHGAHLSLIIVIVSYMITLNMPLVYYVIIVLIIRLFINSTCSHTRISECGMVQAIDLHILYWLSDHRVKSGYNYSSTWESYIFNH